MRSSKQDTSSFQWHSVGLASRNTGTARAVWSQESRLYHGQQGRGLATQGPVPQCASRPDPETVPSFNQDLRSSAKFVAEADLRSSQEDKPQVTITTGEDKQGQTQPHDCQAGPW